MNLVVISTAYAPLTRHLCEASVRAQLGGPYEHLYIDAEQQDPERTCSQNLWMMIGGLNPSDVVVWVDGDDWLAHNLVLGDVAAMHKRGALLTYGSYITKDGEPGISAPYIGTEYRREPWKASHLKTFRAGLFQQLTAEDLQHGGQWIEDAVDVAVMLPMLELVGPEHVLFCEETLLIYAGSNNTRPREAEIASERITRARPRKAKLTDAQVEVLRG